MYDVLALDAVGLGGVGRPEDGSVLIGMEKSLALKYGENPHQTAAYFAPKSATRPEVLKGELSYNNILDLDCALETLREFEGKAAVVTKHGGPCGAAEACAEADALDRALAGDPLSAFGGIVGVNFIFGAECAEVLGKRFVECIVAPEFSGDALGLLSKKRTRLVAVAPGPLRSVRLRSALAGILVQSSDDVLLGKGLECVTGTCPTGQVLEDLLFAWKVAKHVRSNAIVFAGGSRTLGIGAGQPSRVDATRIAIQKAAQAGHNLKGSVVASDGFFPFPDSIGLAAAAGAQAVIQPGGSRKDAEVIAAARRLGLAMVLTGTRHFRH